mmetsp:Transcript_12998/g.12835  ORF Transcript_12998/g.12835 Transcript_12998/m.12835 type:complete len:145 (+) Transcript_12998:163-597(+)
MDPQKMVYNASGEPIHQTTTATDNISNNKHHHQSRSSSSSKRQVGGAAVAGGAVGLLLVGPFVGIAAAGGAALVASKNKGEAGKAARTTGDAMSDLGTSVKKLDKKHHIREKTSNGIVKGCNWISNKLSQQQQKKNSNNNGNVI